MTKQYKQYIVTRQYTEKLIRLAGELKTLWETPIVTTPKRVKMDNRIREDEITSKLMYLVGYIEALEGNK